MHNRCDDNTSECVLNPTSEFGYDCVCNWPTAPDASRFGEAPKLPVGSAGYGDNNGCIIPDPRNVNSDYKDNLILYGGGWNAQKAKRWPDGKPDRIKPHWQYYGLEATNDPWRYLVKEAPQKIPAPSTSSHNGKFYNCMMNIEPNRVMVVGGRPGQWFHVFDDKTFVYEWGKNSNDIVSKGQWIGTGKNFF